MTKFFLFALLTTLLVLGNTQPAARIDLNGAAHYSSVSGWTCAINFLQRGGIVRTESMSASYTFALLSDFDWIEAGDANIIDAVSYSGTSCNCWVVLFDDDGYEGDTLGLWTTNFSNSTNSTQGSYDLTAYNYIYDRDALGDDNYRQWNTAVNAYKIFCY